MKLVTMVVAAVLAAAPLGAQEPAAMPAWMAGAWEQRDGERWADEFWTPPRAGMMIGAARTGSGDRLGVWEHTRIVRQADGSLSFLAQPRGAPATEFPQVDSGPQMVEFANPEHDYPQRVRYWREGRELKARISRMDGSDAAEWSYAPMGG
jgi:hypothetical protein